MDPTADELEYRERLQRALGTDFELRELIGQGGFGSVYAAWDRKLDRDVAVKALRHDLFPTRLVLERFQREAKAVAKLRHKNILPVYAVGEGDGIAFMIMPVIRGPNLKALITGDRRVDSASVIRIIGEVARALDAAHRLGIIHRDVKPENILLEGDDHHPLLSDFGIAKSVEGGGELTGSGVILGSPHYMSPEQAAAEKTLDGRSDVYSLGAVAYEMLAGRRPFEATSLQQMLVLQFTTEPTPLAEVAPDVPTALSHVVMRALARDPAQRWQTAGEFAAAVAASNPPQVSPAIPESSWFARRGLVIAFLNAIGLLTTIIGLPLSDVAAASNNKALELAVALLRAPLRFLVPIGLFYLIAEFLYTLVRARRAGLSRDAVRRRMFEQPGWWQPWYPRSLRGPDSIWDRMPTSVKVIRTALWFIIASTFFFPFALVLPQLSGFAAGSNLPLALPVRMVISMGGFMERFTGIGLALVVAGVLVESIRYRVSPLELVRLLFSWRESRWNTPAGRRVIAAASS